ncbi:MAG: HIT domain-containing protein [Candidatus Glassbacteria bacterium]|nr:HIT domain-containing protein [Candidatus Glassbacteria bacterium]
MRIDRNLIIPGKLSYVRGKKPGVDCILCALRDRDERVPRLDVLEHELMIVTLNLYPYNPGHLMIFPRRHLTDIRQFTREEILTMHRLQEQSITALEKVYAPTGFNIGYNQGKSSGASIEHLHCHIIPRHRNEIGLLEMISRGSRVLVEDPLETLEKLRAAFAETGK